MTKQEEIMSDSGLGAIELGVEDLCGILEGHTHLTPQGRDKILSYLHAQGMVMKVADQNDLVYILKNECEIVAVEPLKKKE